MAERFRVLGLDQSLTETGWAVADDTPSQKAADMVKAWGCFQSPKRTDVRERFAKQRDELVALVAKYHPDLIVLETPFMPIEAKPDERKKGKNTRAHLNLDTSIKLHQLVAVLGLVAFDHDVPLEMYPSQSWRKDVIGFSRAPNGDDRNHAMKKITLDHLRRVYRLQLGDNLNISDAVGIAICAIIGRPASKRKQGDLLDMIGVKL